MARIRNRTDDIVQLVAVGGKVPFVLSSVDPDEIVEVPDDIYLAHAWPETIWDLIDVPKPVEAEEAVEGKMSDVLDRVSSGEVTAQEALDAEQAKPRPRVTLVEHLQSLINDAQEG